MFRLKVFRKNSAKWRQREKRVRDERQVRKGKNHNITQEGLWLHSLFTELSVPFDSPVPIYLDNSGAIALSAAAKFHQHSKHIDLHFHFIREHIDNSSFTLIWVPSHRNIADILMKALPRLAFERLCLSLGLVAQ